MLRQAFHPIRVTVLAVVAFAPHVAVAERLDDPAALTEQAPDRFSVEFETTKGKFVVDVTRAWAPLGADRFYNLVKHGFYDDVRFFRVVPDFVVQFGLNGDPAIGKPWQSARIKDDPVTRSNEAGTLTFAMAGPNSRTTQVFINLKSNKSLDQSGFSPFGEVSAGMDVVRKLYAGYGDQPPRGRGPNQSQIAMEGNEYLDRSFPKLDAIVDATLIENETADEAAGGD
ncbi:MAG TPA: peptidylprolyl isomerase [Candidatus Polarisedimenticolaceae bacterium]|nr:peptidylprolyl isomerase [Candidatus Polarisedimenticolaceae bacterium]